MGSQTVVHEQSNCTYVVQVERLARVTRQAWTWIELGANRGSAVTSHSADSLATNKLSQRSLVNMHR
jgi:hypothetical protein